MTLGEEIKQILYDHHRSEDNIRDIFNSEGRIIMSEFWEAAMSLDMDDDTIPFPKVDPSIVLQARSWYMTREIIDDKEGWLFHFQPIAPTPLLSMVDIRGHGRIRDTDLTINRLEGVH